MGGWRTGLCLAAAVAVAACIILGSVRRDARRPAILEQQGSEGRGGAHAGARVKLATWSGSVFDRDVERRDLPMPTTTSDWLHPHLDDDDDDGGGEEKYDEVERLKRKMSSAEKQLQDAQGALRRAEDDVKQYTAAPAWTPPSGPSISAFPLSIRSGEEVTVSWSGIKHPTEEDFIAVVTPPGAPNTEIIERVPVTVSDTYLEGHGETKVKLYNLRQEGGYQMRYFAKSSVSADSSIFAPLSAALLRDVVWCPSGLPCDGSAEWLLAASSESVTFPPHEPTQARLSLTGVPSEMRLMWVSTECPPGPLGGPIVTYGSSSCRGVGSAREYAQGKQGGCEYEMHAVPMFRTYGKDDMCGAPANLESMPEGFIDPGYIYDAVMTGLQPGRRYFYRFGCRSASKGWEQAHSSFTGDPTVIGGTDHTWAAGVMMSEEHSFYTTPVPGQATRMLFISDSGVSGLGPHLNGHVSHGAPELVAKHVAMDVEASPQAAVVHLGDIVYSSGKSYRWDQWGDMFSPISSAAPLMVTVGNHEVDHLPKVWVHLSGATASGVPPGGITLLASPLPFGTAIAQWSDPSASGRVTVVPEGGLCGAGGEEEKRVGLAAYDGMVLVSSAGDCDMAAQAHRAVEFGSIGVIFVSGSPQPRETAGSGGGAINVPCVLLGSEEGVKLTAWARHASGAGLRVSMRGSESLQKNDPSLPPGGGAGFHPSWGNYADDSYGECGVPFAQRFHMPPGGNGNFWYAFDYGLVRVIVMSTEHDYTSGSPQRAWLEAQLGAVDRESTPWLVVTMHRPIYTRIDSSAEQRLSTHMQDELETLFYESAVDIVLSGHEHRYMRSHPVYQDLNMPAAGKGSAPTYIVAGTGGARPLYRHVSLPPSIHPSITASLLLSHLYSLPPSIHPSLHPSLPPSLPPRSQARLLRHLYLSCGCAEPLTPSPSTSGGKDQMKTLNPELQGSRLHAQALLLRRGGKGDGEVQTVQEERNGMQGPPCMLRARAGQQGFLRGDEGLLRPVRFLRAHQRDGPGALHCFKPSR